MAVLTPALLAARPHLIHFATNSTNTKNASQYTLGCAWNASSKWENYADAVCNIAESVFSFFISGVFSSREVWREYKPNTDSDLNDGGECQVLKSSFSSLKEVGVWYRRELGWSITFYLCSSISSSLILTLFLLLLLMSLYSMMQCARPSLNYFLNSCLWLWFIVFFSESK